MYTTTDYKGKCFLSTGEDPVQTIKSPKAPSQNMVGL